MDTDATPKKRRLGAMVAAAAACLAVALPVSGAFAQNDGDSQQQRTTPEAPQQQDRSQQERPRDGDCPEKDGNRGEGQNEGSSSGASAYRRRGAAVAPRTALGSGRLATRGGPAGPA